MSETPTSNSTALPGAIRQRSLAPPDSLVSPTTESSGSRCHPFHGAPDRFAPRKSSPPPPLGSSTRGGLDSIREEAEFRGIRRLCHFTDSANLARILSSGQGIRSTAYLRKDGLASLVTADQWRWDGHLDHVCLSVQFPNAWCFRSIRAERRYSHGVVLFVEPDYLWKPDTKFCPVNAAREGGGRIASGPNGFRAMFARTVTGHRTYTRGSDQPNFLPTDEQAEVLVRDGVLRDDIVGCAVRDEAQARREHRRLLGVGIKPPKLVVVPEFYDPYRMSHLLRGGELPKERPWQPQSR